MKVYTMQIEEEDLRDLKVIAAKRDTSAAQIVRDAIKKIIKEGK